MLRNNTAACDFYQHKMKFSVDATDPSQSDEAAPYIILSKCVDKAGAAAAEERVRRIEAGEETGGEAAASATK